MIDGLVGGSLCEQPVRRTGKSGRIFVTAKIRAAVVNSDPIFVNVAAFDEGVADALLALDVGDSVSIAGPLTPKAWTGRDGIARPAMDIVANALLTPYHVTRKRQAVSDRRVSDPRDEDFPDDPL